MSGLMSLLCFFPFVVALALLVTGSNRIRRPIVGTGVAAVIIGSVALALPNVPASVARLPVSADAISTVMLVFEAVISLYLLWLSVRTRRPLIGLLALAQAGLLFPLELGGGHHAEVARYLVLDQFSIVLTLIVGVVGGLICLYAIDYMQEFHVKIGRAHV